MKNKSPGYCLFIPSGGHTVYLVPLPEVDPPYEFWRTAIRFDGSRCLGFMYFGPSRLQLVAIHDDEFLLASDHPTGTVTINGVVLCDNVVITKLTPRDRDLTGLTEEEAAYVVPRLKLAGGKVTVANRAPLSTIETFDNPEDFLKRLHEKRIQDPEWEEEP